MCMLCEDKYLSENEYAKDHFGYDKASLPTSGENSYLRLVFRESDKSYALWMNTIVDEIFPIFYCPICGRTLKELPEQRPVGQCVVEESADSDLIQTMVPWIREVLELSIRMDNLEEEVGVLRNRMYSSKTDQRNSPSVSKKYRYLSDYLRESNQSRVRLSFAEIERILKFTLPNSAKKHRSFWANTGTHSVALSWLSVNYEVVEANLKESYVVFEAKRNFNTNISHELDTVIEQYRLDLSNTP